MFSKSHDILRNKGIYLFKIVLISLIVISCSKNESAIFNGNAQNTIDTVELPKRSGSRPETTMGVPHFQIGVELVPEVNEELFRRVYSLPGLENRNSVVGGWRGLWLTEEVTVVIPEAIISGREFGHIHDDGSLHVFLETSRSYQAVSSCWAVLHPYAVERLDGWEGFVMLYTPQSLNELDVTFQIIVDGYNYVTGQNLLASDYHQKPYEENHEAF